MEEYEIDGSFKVPMTPQDIDEILDESSGLADSFDRDEKAKHVQWSFDKCNRILDILVDYSDGINIDSLMKACSNKKIELSTLRHPDPREFLVKYLSEQLDGLEFQGSEMQRNPTNSKRKSRNKSPICLKLYSGDNFVDELHRRDVGFIRDVRKFLLKVKDLVCSSEGGILLECIEERFGQIFPEGKSEWERIVPVYKDGLKFLLGQILEVSVETSVADVNRSYAYAIDPALEVKSSDDRSKSYSFEKKKENMLKLFGTEWSFLPLKEIGMFYFAAFHESLGEPVYQLVRKIDELEIVENHWWRGKRVTTVGLNACFLPARPPNFRTFSTEYNGKPVNLDPGEDGKMPRVFVMFSEGEKIFLRRAEHDDLAENFSGRLVKCRVRNRWCVLFE